MEEAKKAKGDGIIMKVADLDPDAVLNRINKPVCGVGNFDDGVPFSFVAIFKGLMARGESLEAIVELPSISELGAGEKNWTILNYQNGHWLGYLGPNQGFKVTLDL